MRKTIGVITGCLVVLSLASGALAKDSRKRQFFIQHDYSSAYAVQRVSVKTACFPDELKAILAHIAVKTGRKPIVTSGHRPKSGRSQHSHCLAADIRVPGVSEKTIIAAAASAPGIGGIGRYCNGIVHVDIGPKRRWSHC